MEHAFDPACMKPEDLALRECKVELWANMVWINQDLGAKPLMDSLGPVAPLLDGVGVGLQRVKWWKQVVLNANWKIAQEAFMEAYHAPIVHPQLMLGGTEDEAARVNDGLEYTAFPGGHGRFQTSVQEEPDYDAFNFDKFLRLQKLLAEGQDAMAIERDIHILEGLRTKIGDDDPHFAQKAIMALYEHAEGAGIPMPPLSEAMALWSGEIFMFPNFLMLPQFGNCLCYRSRPYEDDPEKVIFDVWSLMTYPEGEEPERAELNGIFDKDDDENWGLIPRQDFGNIERQQRGMHSKSYEHHRLSSQQEKSIINMHVTLDRVLAGRA
jgi:phenylpropionate dioxygenase-like ring-hydroxylating dioxygenase large terminal subunit